MKETLKKIVNKKYFHICMIFTIIVIILFTLGMICLKYNVEGETNMPFRLSKITVISSSEGIDKENLENKWAFDVNQNNDVFLYIEKNKKNHVLYRVTPIFKENNLLASGVEMEAYSVEDNGKGVCFNVYVYNVQPGANIDYSTGKLLKNTN